MTANLSSLYNAGSLYEQLIGQVMQIESQPRLKLSAAKSDETIYKAVLSDFDSRVSALHSRLEGMADPFRSPFAAMTATAGEGGGFSAAATDEATAGEHRVRVLRLAAADTRLSRQYTSAATDLSSSLGASARTLTVGIAQSDGSVVDLDVSFAPPEGATNADVLAGISAAINSAVEAAEDDGTLEEGTGARATLIRESGTHARLSLRSDATGYGNKLSISGDPDLLAALEIGNESVRSGTGGGAVYEVGADAASSALSASFELDGLAIYRDSNTVSDALDGVTFTLTAPGDESRLTVAPNAGSMRKEIDAFVKDYNALITFLNQKSAVDPDSGNRGAFAGDAGVNALRFGLRTDATGTMEGALSGLAALGIETERDGKLKITDESKLTDALASSPGAVAAVFDGEDGIASRMSTRLDSLLGSDGVIASRQKATEQRINRIGDQIERWDSRLAARESSLRDQFNLLQEVLAQVQSQQNSLAYYSGVGYY